MVKHVYINYRDEKGGRRLGGARERERERDARIVIVGGIRLLWYRIRPWVLLQ